MSTDGVDNADTGSPSTKSEGTPQPSRKRKPSLEKNTPVISQFTIRNPDWSYIHLQLVTPASLAAAAAAPSAGPMQSRAENLDEVTVYLHLQAALNGYLGLHGTAIPLDILKVHDNETWVRTPREDVDALAAAAGGWVGGNSESWRVMGWGAWGPIDGDCGRSLFG